MRWCCATAPRARPSRWRGGCERAHVIERRRRLARASDPGARSTASRSARCWPRRRASTPASLGRGLLRGTAGRDRRATSATAGWRARRCSPYAALGARDRPVRPEQPPAGRPSRAGRSRSPSDLDDALGRRRRGLAPPAPGRTGERLVRSFIARVHGRPGAHQAPGGPPRGPCDRDAPRAHGAWRRDRFGRGGPAPSLVTRQVTNGVAVRMAVLFLLLGAEPGPGWKRRHEGDCPHAPASLSRRHGRRSRARRPRRRGSRRTRRWSRWPSERPAVGDRGPRRRTGAPSLRASSTCTPTFESPVARRPRPSRPARGPPRSAGSPRSSRCPTPSHPSTPRWSPRGARAEPRQPAEVAVAGALTVGRGGEVLAPMPELAALGVTLFTDDGAGVQGGALMRTRARVRRGTRGDARPALRGPSPRRGRGDARGRVVPPPRPARPPRPRRDHDARPRPRPRPPDRRADALFAPVDARVGRPRAAAPGAAATGHRRGHPAPPLLTHAAFSGTTRCSRSTCRFAPADAVDALVAERWRGHDRRDRHRPCPAPRRGEGPAVRRGTAGDARGWRRPGSVALGVWVGVTSSGAGVRAAVRRPRRSRGSPRVTHPRRASHSAHGGASRRARPRTSVCSTRAAGPCTTPPSRQPVPQLALPRFHLRGRVRHTGSGGSRRHRRRGAARPSEGAPRRRSSCRLRHGLRRHCCGLCAPVG